MDAALSPPASPHSAVLCREEDDEEEEVIVAKEEEEKEEEGASKVRPPLGGVAAAVCRGGKFPLAVLRAQLVEWAAGWAHYRRTGYSSGFCSCMEPLQCAVSLGFTSLCFCFCLLIYCSFVFVFALFCFFVVSCWCIYGELYVGKLIDTTIFNIY